MKKMKSKVKIKVNSKGRGYIKINDIDLSNYCTQIEFKVDEGETKLKITLMVDESDIEAEIIHANIYTEYKKGIKWKKNCKEEQEKV